MSSCFSDSSCAGTCIPQYNCSESYECLPANSCPGPNGESCSDQTTCQGNCKAPAPTLYYYCGNACEAATSCPPGQTCYPDSVTCTKACLTYYCDDSYTCQRVFSPNKCPTGKTCYQNPDDCAKACIPPPTVYYCDRSTLTCTATTACPPGLTCTSDPTCGGTCKQYYACSNVGKCEPSSCIPTVGERSPGCYPGDPSCAGTCASSQANSSSNTKIFIGLGAALIITVIIAWVLLRKKN